MIYVWPIRLFIACSFVAVLLCACREAEKRQSEREMLQSINAALLGLRHPLLSWDACSLIHTEARHLQYF